MAAQPMPAFPEPQPEAPPSPARLVPCAPRLMTRCECAGASFAEIARQVHVEGRALCDVLKGSGCGQTCGGCVPDLQLYLKHRS